MTEATLIDFIHAGQAYTAYLVVLAPMALAFLCSWLEEFEGLAARYKLRADEADAAREAPPEAQPLSLPPVRASVLAPERTAVCTSSITTPLSPEEQAELYVALALAA